MAQHTEGPWLAREKHFGVSAEPTPYVSEGDSARVLCYMNLSGAYNGNANIAQAKADARLIAAAPELLAALIEVVAIADRKTNEFDRARAAIAKATSP